MIPVAILCGGHGTRSNLAINKCFVDVNGKPFILRIIENLETFGFTNFVLCRGTNGTLSALRDARESLGERFLVVYGDTYLPIDYTRFLLEWEGSGRPSITAVYDGIDAGVNGFVDWTLDLLDDTETSLVSLRSELRARYMTQHFFSKQKWHEVGTPEALAETRAALI